MKYIIILLFLLHVFLRFYQLETRLIFAVDQLDSAWAARRILVDHIYPILGPSNKLGSGIYIGPAYYYLISIVYFFTNLDPIAAGIFAGLTSVFNFWVIYFITKNLFSKYVALIALFIHTVAYPSIQFDRMQWEVNFIPSVSLIFFYLLYRIICGKTQLIPWLLFVLGASFHVHLTVAAYLSIILVLTTPFWLRSKRVFLHTLIASPIFFLWLIPIIAGYTQSMTTAKPIGYVSSAFHGVHLQRFLQVFSKDLFIEVDAFFPNWIKLFVVPAFILVSYLRARTMKTAFLCFLVLLWFVIPPFVLSLYNGEITIYYHSTTRYVSLLVGSYLIWELWRFKFPILATLLVLLGLYFSYTNVKFFLDERVVSIHNWRVITLDAIANGQEIPFRENYTPSYLYYVYTRK